jgi:hypothetical protein
MSNVCSPSKNSHIAKYTSAANVASRHILIFGSKMVSFGPI